MQFKDRNNNKWKITNYCIEDGVTLFCKKLNETVTVPIKKFNREFHRIRQYDKHGIEIMTDSQVRKYHQRIA